MDREKRKHEVPMAKQDVLDRIHNFYEVALGYTEEQAMLEAERYFIEELANYDGEK